MNVKLLGLDMVLVEHELLCDETTYPLQNASADHCETLLKLVASPVMI